MSDQVIRVNVDVDVVPVTDAIRTAAHAASLLILSAWTLGELAAEVGGDKEAVRYLADIADEIGRPIAANAGDGAGGSSTAFLAPRAWSEERLKGWVAGHHELLAREFGPVTLAPVEEPS